MSEYTPNSHKYKEEQSGITGDKRAKKVVTNVTKTKKKSDIQKFADVFISEDIANVKNYILMDVLIPGLKKTLSSVLKNGIDMILYGEADERPSSTSGTRVAYHKFYDDELSRNHAGGYRSRTGHDYDDIVFATRNDAKAVLAEMNDLISIYGMASIADLYSAAGQSCSYTYNDYGWSDIRSAEIIPVRDGYVIKFPKALPLK